MLLLNLKQDLMLLKRSDTHNFTYSYVAIVSNSHPENMKWICRMSNVEEEVRLGLALRLELQDRIIH